MIKNSLEKKQEGGMHFNGFLPNCVCKGKKMKKSVCAIIVAAALSCLPGLLLAQDSDTVQHLDEVVITATQTENSIMKTASNISVISAKDIERLDAENVAEVLRTLPGISYTNASGLEPKVNLRGTKIGMSSGE